MCMRKLSPARLAVISDGVEYGVQNGMRYVPDLEEAIVEVSSFEFLFVAVTI